MMLDQFSYVPGQGYLAVGAGPVVYSSDLTLVRTLWPAVRDGGDTATVLAGALAGGFDSLADLLVMEVSDDGVEILIRGDIEVTAVDLVGERQQVDGNGVRTWRECRVANPASVTMGVVEGGPSLPVKAGIVCVSGLRWFGDEESASPTAASPTAASSTVSPPAAVSPVSVESPKVSMTKPAEPVQPAAPVEPAQPAEQVEPAHTPQPVQPVEPAQTSQPVSPAQDPPSPLVTPAPGPQGAAPSTESTRVGEDDEFGHLFESTVMRSPEDAAVRLDPEDDPDDDAEEESHTTVGPAVGGAAESQLGDHDGATILGGQLAALLTEGGAGSPVTGAGSPAGRHNSAQPVTTPVASTQAPSSVNVPSPTNATGIVELAFSTGQVIPVDQPVIVGRKPQASRVDGAQIPRLVTATGPHNDISRSHVELRPDGDAIVATDLGSTNGTLLTDGGGTRPLTAHAPARIGVGARLDLGDGVTIDVRAAAQ